MSDEKKIKLRDLSFDGECFRVRTDRDELVERLSRHATLPLIRDAIDRIQADAATIAGMQWQPIETAPRDSGDFLVTDGFEIEIAHWHRDHVCGFENGADDFTHWMPLPNPPALKGGDHGR